MLTPEQRLKLKKAGYSEAKINAYEAKKLTIEQTPVEGPGFGERVKQDFQERKQKLGQINTSDQSTGSKILQNVGQVAGGVSDLILEGVKSVTPDVIEKPVGQAISSVTNKVMQTQPAQDIKQKYDAWAQAHPEAAGNLGAILNIAGIIPEGKILSAGEKGLVKGAGLASEGAIKSAQKVGKVATKAGKVTSDIAGDLVPAADRIVNHKVTRALDLTQADVKNINLSTGNEVGRFMADKNLIGKTKQSTLKNVDNFYNTQYKTVRDEISKVKKNYSINEVPRFKQTVSEIQKEVGDTAGLESTTNELKTLAKKKSITLNDVQRVKELLDEHFALYKATGDVASGVKKQGLSTLRQDLRGFIEKEVKNTTGADIKALNNDVATSRSIKDAIETRSTRGLTRSNFKMGDFTAFGAGTVIGSPALGFAAVAIKKLWESPSVQLRVAKYIDKLSDAKKLKIKEVMDAGKIPKELEQFKGKK